MITQSYMRQSLLNGERRRKCINLILDPFMIREAYPSLTETASGSHPRRVGFSNLLRAKSGAWTKCGQRVSVMSTRLRRVLKCLPYMDPITNRRPSFLHSWTACWFSHLGEKQISGNHVARLAGIWRSVCKKPFSPIKKHSGKTERSQSGLPRRNSWLIFKMRKTDHHGLSIPSERLVSRSQK